MADERIASVMQTDFPRLRPGMPIRDAVAVLVEHGTAAAPVLDESGQLVGIMTQKDCFRSALNASYYQQWSGTVAEHMTAKVATLEPETNFLDAAEAFLQEPYRAYPVVCGGVVAGMLTRADLLAVFLHYG